MLPLEMLAISACPEWDGFEIVTIDGSLYDQEDTHLRVLEACEGAMLYGVTGNLGFMVKDGYPCSPKVRARYPQIKIVAGGWFASVGTDLLLKTGFYDGVIDGQGELPFKDLVEATAAGEPWDDIESLVLWRDGDLLLNQNRQVVRWDKLLDMPWHLLDIEPYRARQLQPDSHAHILRMPTPKVMGERKPDFGITYFSSFGCPEPCEYCCSPFVTNRRWKAMPVERMLDDLRQLKERCGFDVERFHDANLGVMEKRVREG